MAVNADRPMPDLRRTWRILVLDDDELSGSVQSQMLQLLGFEASTGIDSQQAIRRAAAEPFDLMLVDLSMPRIGGFDVLRLLRAAEAEQGRRPLPLIAVTGFVSPEDRERCLAAGFAGHLTKPVQLAKLKETIEDVLGSPRPPGAEPARDSTTDAERLRATVQRLGQMAPAEGRFSPTVTEAFALRSAQLIDLLHQAVDDGDRRQAVLNAQALDANAQFLGASRLAASAAAIARHCDAADWPQARQELHEFERQQQAVLSVLFQVDR